MGLDIESRSSDSPYIERVWRSSSRDVEQMTAVATAHWDLVFWEHRGQVSASVQGPETRASQAPVPEDATFFGISFSLGTVMPHLPLGRLVDGSAEIPDTTHRSFWLKGSTWHLPDWDNAEAFVQRLVREGVVERDPLVAAVLRGASPDVSERTVQRRFLASTGLTRGAVRQIDRARRAAVLIQQGVPAHDMIHRLGYFDQPHLARSLSRYIGRTATQLGDRKPSQPLSLLYAT
ncbi:helix-turn-helix domain-containing protein [Microbispora siamensis]|uniref:AraC family transcriptional regulator n=1 Tax=Microbispora siamensis TaxID=564413 RepID=A0ABQ4GLH7_9ACTN|nr:helix-turn-helix domain-containing protein [Microbispora siamensis]GIH62269.1 AraC family transcriptional regulator [Microbispora siamensis]